MTASDFQFSQNESESLDKQFDGVNSLQNDRPTLLDVPEILCEVSASIDTNNIINYKTMDNQDTANDAITVSCSPGSPSILPFFRSDK